MIDRDNRDCLADLLERLLRAEVTFEQYERELGEARFEASADRGVTMVCHAADSLSEEANAQPGDHLTADRFSENLLRNVRRSAHFLRSESEFEWPEMKATRTRLVTALEAWGTLGIIIIPLADLWLFAPNSNGVFACVLAVVNCAASWTASKRLQRRLAEEEGSRLAENRNLAAWPYARRADVPPELLGEISPAGGPHG